MGILDKLKKILPKRKEPELKNTVPKERENIRKTFGVYCNANHETEGGKLCPKCTALLSTVMIKIQRCPYGTGKPICDKCETPCFGENQTKEFRAIMQSGQKKMIFSNPIMAVKHKLASLSVDYAKAQHDKNATEKQKAAEDKVKARIANAVRSPKSKSKKRKKK